jgi:hypothetical protein
MIDLDVGKKKSGENLMVIDVLIIFIISKAKWNFSVNSIMGSFPVIKQK